MGANFPSILRRKTYFFYFTHSILQNTHISLSILHIYSIKYLIFYNFLLFFSSLPLSLTDQQYQWSLHTQPRSSPTQPTSSRKINPLNPRKKHSETHSHPKPSQSTPSTLWSHHQLNPKPARSTSSPALVLSHPLTHPNSAFRRSACCSHTWKKRDKVIVETRWRRHFFFSTQICDEKRRNFFFLFFCLVIFLNGFYSLFYQMIRSNEEKGEWGFDDQR